METFVFILSTIGVVAFTISGAMVSIEYQADVFGVVFLGFINTFGGGMLRDVLIGKIPPAVFTMHIEVVVCILTALAVFFVAFFFKRSYLREEVLLKKINNVLDAIGIGIFAVAGAQAAMNMGYTNPFLVVFMGMVTCIGGGMIRDVSLGAVPYVLKKRIYALAVIAGTALYWLFLHFGAPQAIAMIAGALTIFMLRMLATVFKWNMPRVVLTDEQAEPVRGQTVFERAAHYRSRRKTSAIQDSHREENASQTQKENAHHTG